MDIPFFLYEDIIRNALAEDIGAGDITTLICVPPGKMASASVLAKSKGVVAGLFVGAAVFRMLDPKAEWEQFVVDGAEVPAGVTQVARVFGDARALLTAERTALNLMQRMSGIATVTRRYAAKVAGTKARVVDTRKTVPGLRVLDKYSVRAGGGHNHRTGLYDNILIKDNHLRVAGGVRPAVLAARAGASHTMKIEVECSTLDEVAEALDVRADIILLDNMDVQALAAAVRMAGGRAVMEASGGIDERTVAEVAATGVDVISVGALTHSVVAMDISLDFTL